MSDTDIGYYRAQDILDRIEFVRKKKSMYASHLSKALGKCSAYWSVKYDAANALRLSTVKKIAKAIDESVEYILYGTNEGPYIDKDIDIARLSEYAYRKNYKLISSQKSILSRIRHGKQNDIQMDIFFSIEETIGKNLLKIITKD